MIAKSYLVGTFKLKINNNSLSKLKFKKLKICVKTLSTWCKIKCSETVNRNKILFPRIVLT